MKKISNLFKGRISRKHFLYGIASMILLLFVTIAILASISSSNDSQNIFWVFYLVVFVFVIVVNLSLFVRRWHDLGKSGYMVLLNFVPAINIVAVLYVLFTGGEPTENQYGKPPSNDINYLYDVLAIPTKNNKVKKNKDGNNVTVDDLTTIEKLADLKKKGAITQEEFNRKKKQILKI